MFTAQITPYTCALACLESFFNEHGVSLNQETLLKDYPDKCFVGRIHEGRDISGALSLPEFKDLCECLGLSPEVGRDSRKEFIMEIARNLRPDQTLIFFITNCGGGEGPTHFVRYSKILDQDSFEVMNPSDNPKFFRISWDDFDPWGVWLIHITVPQNRFLPVTSC